MIDIKIQVTNETQETDLLEDIKHKPGIYMPLDDLNVRIIVLSDAQIFVNLRTKDMSPVVPWVWTGRKLISVNETINITFSSEKI